MPSAILLILRYQAYNEYGAWTISNCTEQVNVCLCKSLHLYSISSAKLKFIGVWFHYQIWKLHLAPFGTNHILLRISMQKCAVWLRQHFWTKSVKCHLKKCAKCSNVYAETCHLTSQTSLRTSLSISHLLLSSHLCYNYVELYPLQSLATVLLCCVV